MTEKAGARGTVAVINEFFDSATEISAGTTVSSHNSRVMR
tara:strand:+ start:221 stop:340 length:120 start_codon:yes stop_codon:yes gene_type:complete